MTEMSNSLDTTEETWTSINMRPTTKSVVNRISKREGMYAYAVIEKALRETYPADFR
jgi:hypothetical protein